MASPVFSKPLKYGAGGAAAKTGAAGSVATANVATSADAESRLISLRTMPLGISLPWGNLGDGAGLASGSAQSQAT
jgi:hypothetical protein